MSGPLRLVPGDGGEAAFPGRGRRPGAGPRRRRPSWAAADPLDELAERLGEAVSAAVHPYEVAAVLESDGLTDEQITGRYQRADLFEVAAALHERVARTFPEPPADTGDPWRVETWRCLLRGFLFALPGLAYVLGARLLGGPPGLWGLPSGTPALAASALAGWAWNQALAHRAYLRLGTEGRRAAAACLRLGVPAGAVAATLPALPLADAPAAALFAAGQSLYLAAATALLVLGRERDLLPALAPTAACAGALLLLDVPDAAAAAVLAATAAGAAAAAVRALAAELRTGGGAGTGAGTAGAPSLLRSLPYGVFGLACGVLTLLTALGEQLYRAGGPFTGAAAVALTLSMGAAEWLLYRYRSRGLAALRRSTGARAFRAAAGRALALCLGGYLAVLALLAGAAAAAVRVWPVAAPLGPLRLLALLALGAVLWVALLLQAFGTAWPPALVCTGAAAAECAAVAARPAEPPVVQLAVCGLAALVLLAIAHSVLGRTTAHR